MAVTAFIFVFGVVFVLLACLAASNREVAGAWFCGIIGIVFFLVAIAVGKAEEQKEGLMSTVVVDEKFEGLEMGVKYEVIGSPPSTPLDEGYAVILRDHRNRYHLYRFQEAPPECRFFFVLDVDGDEKKEFHCLK